MPASDDALARSLDDLSAMTAGEDALVERIIDLLDRPFSQSAQQAAAAFLASDELRRANAAAKRVMSGSDEEGEVSEC